MLRIVLALAALLPLGLLAIACGDDGSDADGPVIILALARGGLGDQGFEGR